MADLILLLLAATLLLCALGMVILVINITLDTWRMFR